jgi:hypothetical protein
MSSCQFPRWLRSAALSKASDVLFLLNEDSVLMACMWH